MRAYITNTEALNLLVANVLTECKACPSPTIDKLPVSKDQDSVS